jgi:sugar lactone lactonase YvrE
VKRATAGGPLQSTSAKTLVDTESGLKFAKSPRWVDHKLMFLDVHDRCIKSVDMHGAVQLVSTLPFQPGGFGVLADGGMLVGDALRRHIHRWEIAGTRQQADLSRLTGFCLSDGIVDGRGGMYVDDAGFDFLDPLVDPVPNGVIAHISADGKSSVVARDLFYPHGMVITPDNSTLIVAETLAHRLTAFEINDDGSLQNRRIWARLQNEIRPQGICLDRDGAIWVAGTQPWALRVREGGEIDHRVKTKRPVFAAMLGGAERKHLFLCTSTSHDPVITRRFPSASIDIAEVETPGCGFP